MLKRTNKDGLVIDSEDCHFIRDRINRLPESVHGYALATRYFPDASGRICVFDWRDYPYPPCHSERWHRFDGGWPIGVLVLRRCKGG